MNIVYGGDKLKEVVWLTNEDNKIPYVKASLHYKGFIRPVSPKVEEEPQEVATEGTEEASEPTYTIASRRIGTRHRRRRS